MFFKLLYLIYLFFFFQAEDGIRDGTVTGVQTCALPIWPWPRAGAGLSSRAHIMGVMLSETTSETTMASVNVTANSRKRRPTIPPIKRIGMNTATSEVLIDS